MEIHLNALKIQSVLSSAAQADVMKKLQHTRLVALDLDGTVLTDSKHITARTQEALIHAHQAGMEIVIVTGRPLRGLPDELESFPGIRYAITSNGAVTTDLQTGELLRGAFISCSAAKDITRIPIQAKIIYDVFINGCGYCDPAAFQCLVSRFSGTPLESYVRKSRAQTDDIFRLMEETEYGIENIWMMANDRQQRDQINQQILEKWNVRTVLTADRDVEIGAITADKGIALSELASALHINRDEILAIGDNENDLGMLHAAGTAIAMGNSTPSVKQMADLVTDSNEAEGVAKVIELISS